MTRSRLLGRSLVLVSMFVGAAAAASCGGSSSTTDGPPANGGSAGTAGTGGTAGTAGTAGMPEPIACGDLTCDPLTLPFPPNYAAACCAAGNVCGIDASPLEAYGAMFSDPCQPLHQPGSADPTCPKSPPIAVTIDSANLMLTFPGCCHTDTNTCGYDLDKLGGLFTLGFGCVDSAPFLDGGTPSPCGSN